MQSKNAIPILLVILIVLVAAIGFFLFKPDGSWMKEPTATSTPHEIAGSVKVTNKTIEDKSNSKLDIKADYPEFSGLKNEEAQAKINAAIKSFVEEEINAFKKSEADTSVEEEVVIPEGPGTSMLDISFEGPFESISEEIISLAVYEFYYSNGAAHPGHHSVAFNFSTETGELLTLKDIFKGEYLKFLSSESKESLKADLEENAIEEMISEGTAPKEENFKNFLLTKHDFHVLFNEYQVAPYAAGEQEVMIEYSDLKPYINPSGPLKNL